jgi:acyl carrier protein
MRPEISNTLRRLAVKRFKLDEQTLNESTELNTLGDSLDFLEFLGDIEISFKIDLGTDQLVEASTVGELLNVIEASVAARPKDTNH